MEGSGRGVFFRVGDGKCGFSGFFGVCWDRMYIVIWIFCLMVLSCVGNRGGEERRGEEGEGSVRTWMK